MPENCPHHKEIDYRIAENRRDIDSCRCDIKEIQKMMKSPALMVAVIGLIGTLFSGFMAFLGVVAGPVIRAWLGV